MPRDPQGAETRTETLVEWRNVYRTTKSSLVAQWVDTGRSSREVADEDAAYVESRGEDIRIAIERIETTTTITRHTIPPHAGEEAKG